MAESYFLTALLTPDPDGGQVVQIVERPGAIIQSETVEAALANVRDAAELSLEEATPEEMAGLTAHPVTAPVQVSVA
ncbi:type II toxin-antitoxin system HicB family antitoxin [Amycolatopsis sp. GM8]|uniref:type II toxin-antitoxin system HicB family antitoxin n=1 Tax=Amycolatopsis sp. GM8 TaxID=2896530 RepID=UPI001F386583|nr:type II toxin-antitoxin system HicB family antitoxin [Amycolatopsis sp. GM8]